MTTQDAMAPSHRPRGPGIATLHAIPWLPLALLAPVVIAGILGPAITPHDPSTIDLMSALKPPAWLAGGDVQYLLGTDAYGRDMLSRLVEGARITLIVSLAGVALSAAFGIMMGVVAGYFGGMVDNLIMRLVDIKMAIPSMLLTLLIGGAIGGGLLTIMLSLLLILWTSYARVIRAQTVALRDADFVKLARVANCSTLRILCRHILPNISSSIIVLTTMHVGSAILLEAAITFLGLGIQPPQSAWGLLIAEGRAFAATDQWWIPLFPGLCISVTVLGANLFGDWLRDRLDPHMRGA
jgi:peptide/nickel transport system permease protein